MRYDGGEFRFREPEIYHFHCCQSHHYELDLWASCFRYRRIYYKQWINKSFLSALLDLVYVMAYMHRKHFTVVQHWKEIHIWTALYCKSSWKLENFPNYFWLPRSITMDSFPKFSNNNVINWFFYSILTVKKHNQTILWQTERYRTILIFTPLLTL